MIHTHKVDNQTFKGEIKIELYPWAERMKASKNIVYKIEGDKLVERHEYDQGEATITATVERVRDVNLKCGDIEIKSIDELLMYKEGMKVIHELSPILLNGVSLEKN